MTNHLTDEILQALLLEEHQEAAIAAHLYQCAACREKLEDYRALMADIEKIRPEPFTFDVAALVMERIEHEQALQNHKQTIAFWGVLVFLAAVVLSFGFPYLPAVMGVFNAIPSFTVLLAAGTALVVLLLLLADLNKQYRIKEKRILKDYLPPIQ
ncbi:MAG TPA: hypothetical protein PLS51_12860 [Flavobacterium sp.]|nr:hypothetical protein [Flavobacterium sp.]